MKVKKILKIIAITIMCTLLIEVLYPVTSSYASFLGGAQSESRPAQKPPSPPPSSGGGGGVISSVNNNNDNTETTPDDDNTTETPSGPPATQIVYEDRYVGIKGNAYEDLGYDVSTTGGVDNQKKTEPIEGITVELYQGDTLVDRKLTASDGSYTFEPSPGTYSIKFRYGDTSMVDPNNSELMKKILKYNGQDYITVSVPGSQGYINIEQVEVQQGGKGVLQLFIALDCSSSMTDPSTKVEYNGKEMTRLEIVVESAKELCKELISSGDNIYIGLVFFKGTAYRSVSLTKNLNRLNAALDSAVEISNSWESYNTNVYGALDKTYESYYNNDPETSNRFLTILTDGVPTSDGTTELYSDDDENTAYSKLDTIAETTGGRLRSLREDGIKVISLVTESQEEDPNEYALETQYVEKVFSGDNSDIFESIEDGSKTVDIIKEQLKDYLITSTATKEEFTEIQIISGYEDRDRREEVDEQFETMDYSNTSMFQQIDDYTSEEEANKLSEATYMDVQGGQGYLIQDCPSQPKIITAVWPETGETYIATKIIYKPVYYEAQNIVLARKPGFALVTKMTATGLRVVLQNGQILDTQTREPGDDFLMLETLDNELAYGTLIQIEYTIDIKNDSSIQCNYLEILNYLPTGFVYDDNISLITANGTNANTGWEFAALDELYGQNLVTKETVDKFNDKVALKLTLDNAGQGEKGFYIPPGGEYEIKYVVSRMISSLNDIEDGDFEIASEILRYKDNSYRRMEFVNEDIENSTMVGATIQNYKGVFTGDSKDQDFTDDSTNEVIIIPPTGRPKNDIKVYEILTKSVVTSIIDKIRN